MLRNMLIPGDRPNVVRFVLLTENENRKMVPMIQVTPDFRRGRYAEWLRGPRGSMLLVRTCEELVGRHWEPFVSIEDQDTGQLRRALVMEMELDLE